MITIPVVNKYKTLLELYKEYMVTDDYYDKIEVKRGKLAGLSGGTVYCPYIPMMDVPQLTPPMSMPANPDSRMMVDAEVTFEEFGKKVNSITIMK